MKIVMLGIDTLRADHLSCYGYFRQTSPNIDAIAAEGFAFTNCFSVSNCTHPGFTAIFSGLYPESSGIVSHWSRVDPPEGAPMLAEVLHGARLVTAAIDCLHHAWESAHRLYPWFRRGYDIYEWPWHKLAHAPGSPRRVCELISELADRDFFLFYHPWHPHSPYDPPQECRIFTPPASGAIEETAALYDAEIYFTDLEVGQIVEALKQARIFDETLIVITADHGEIMGEERVVLGRKFNWGHIDLCDECVRVPLIFRWPGRVPAGRCDALVQQPDLLPTMLELAGISPSLGLDGTSLVPVMQGRQPGRETVHFVENTYQKKRAIRTRTQKFMRHGQPEISSVVRRELYDLEADPLEQFNEVDRQPDIASELEAKMDRWVRETLAKAGRESDPLFEQEPTGYNLPPAGVQEGQTLSHVYDFAARRGVRLPKADAGAEGPQQPA